MYSRDKPSDPVCKTQGKPAENSQWTWRRLRVDADAIISAGNWRKVAWSSELFAANPNRQFEDFRPRTKRLQSPQDCATETCYIFSRFWTRMGYRAGMLSSDGYIHIAPSKCARKSCYSVRTWSMFPSIPRDFHHPTLLCSWPVEW